MRTGRPKGSRNKRTYDAFAKAEELGADPFEVMLMFATGNWEGLGYDKPTKTMYTAEGSPYEVDIITPEIRLSAAKDATKYLLPQLKSLEHSGEVDLNLARQAQEFQQLQTFEKIELMENQIKLLKGKPG